MKIIEKNIEDIKPYENNPRQNDGSVDKVANSIKEFGFKVPLVIDKNNIIVTGHTRYKASLKLGLKKIPCIIADDLNDTQIKAFRLADNRVAELSSWDLDLLKNELNELNELVAVDYDFNLEDFSFRNDEVDYLNSIEDAETLLNDYKPQEPKKLLCPKCGFMGTKAEYKTYGD